MYVVIYGQHVCICDTVVTELMMSCVLCSVFCVLHWHARIPAPVRTSCLWRLMWARRVERWATCASRRTSSCWPSPRAGFSPLSVWQYLPITGFSLSLSVNHSLSFSHFHSPPLSLSLSLSTNPIFLSLMCLLFTPVFRLLCCIKAAFPMIPSFPFSQFPWHPIAFVPFSWRQSRWSYSLSLCTFALILVHSSWMATLFMSDLFF